MRGVAASPHSEQAFLAQEDTGAGISGGMPVSVALLRAVNVGTTNRIRMEVLRGVFVAAGYPDAATYIQSGNVVFRTADSPATSRARIEAAIQADLGLAVTAIVRTVGELATVATTHPFADRTDDPTRLHVHFLAEELPAALAAAMRARSYGADEWAASGREVYVYYPKGAGLSKFTLKPVATARNWNVVHKLVELARAHGDR